MAILLDYRRPIRSIKNTQQITRAMKFVAAAKLRRAQEGVFAARPYAKEILRVLRSAAARLDPSEHPLLSPAEKKILVVVLTGDRSLCGAFNTNVIRRSTAFLHEKTSKEVMVLPIGKKGRNALKNGVWRFAGEYLNVSGNVNLSVAKEIAGRIRGLFAEREVDAPSTSSTMSSKTSSCTSCSPRSFFPSIRTCYFRNRWKKPKGSTG